jgi:hypothetical protein
MDQSVKDYGIQRAELLANLVLTRRKDVSVFPVGEKYDVGIDLFVRVMIPVMNRQVLPTFGVQVKGTSHPLNDEQAATRYAKGLKLTPLKGLFLFPIVVFLFSMEGDKGYYSWLMEPFVSSEGSPSLERASTLDMTKIQKGSVDDIVQRVVEWFEVMGSLLLKNSKSKQ